jgi:hypothetical protein
MSLYAIGANSEARLTPLGKKNEWELPVSRSLLSLPNSKNRLEPVREPLYFLSHESPDRLPRSDHPGLWLCPIRQLARSGTADSRVSRQPVGRLDAQIAGVQKAKGAEAFASAPLMLNQPAYQPVILLTRIKLGSCGLKSDANKDPRSATVVPVTLMAMPRLVVAITVVIIPISVVVAAIMVARIPLTVMGPEDVRARHDKGNGDESQKHCINGVSGILHNTIPAEGVPQGPVSLYIAEHQSLAFLKGFATRKESCKSRRFGMTVGQYASIRGTRNLHRYLLNASPLDPT